MLRGLVGGVCISITKCVAMVEKELVAGYPVDGFCVQQTWCFSSTAAIGMAV